MMAGGTGVKTLEKKTFESFRFRLRTFPDLLYGTFHGDYIIFDISDKRRKAANLLLLTVVYSSIYLFILWLPATQLPLSAEHWSIRLLGD